jgi:hypothetical protein
MEAVSLAQLKSALPPRPPGGFTTDAVHASTSSGAAFVRTFYEKQIKAAGLGFGVRCYWLLRALTKRMEPGRPAQPTAPCADP